MIINLDNHVYLGEQRATAQAEAQENLANQKRHQMALIALIALTVLKNLKIHMNLLIQTKAKKQ